MNNQSPTPELLHELGLISEQDIAVLTGTTDITRDNWHRRYKGPPRILIGNRRYYHREGLKRYIDALVQARVKKQSENVDDEWL